MTYAYEELDSDSELSANHTLDARVKPGRWQGSGSGVNTPTGGSVSDGGQSNSATEGTTPPAASLTGGDACSSSTTASLSEEEELAWLREALHGEREGTKQKANSAASFARRSGRREGAAHDDVQRYERVDALVERDQNAATVRMGTSLTELRKASAALDEAAEPAGEARRVARARRAGATALAAQLVAEKQYGAARLERARRREEEASRGSVDEQLSADPFEREAYKPLVVLREEATRTLAEAQEEGQRNQEREAGEAKRREEEAELRASLDKALAQAQEAQEMQRRRAQEVDFDEMHVAAFGAAPKALQQGASAKAKRQALLWKRAAMAASTALEGEKTKVVSLAEVAEAAAEEEHERQLRLAKAVEEAEEEARLAEETGAVAHRGAKPTLHRAVKFAAWGARAKQRVKARHREQQLAAQMAVECLKPAAPLKPPTIKFVPREGEPLGADASHALRADFGLAGDIMAEELGALLARARTAETQRLEAEAAEISEVEESILIRKSGASFSDAKAAEADGGEGRGGADGAAADTAERGSPMSFKTGGSPKSFKSKRQAWQAAAKKASGADLVAAAQREHLPSSWAQLLNEAKSESQYKAAAAASGGSAAKVAQRTVEACEDAKRLAWVVGMKEGVARDVELALSDSRPHPNDSLRGGHGAKYHHHTHPSHAPQRAKGARKSTIEHSDQQKWLQRIVREKTREAKEKETGLGLKPIKRGGVVTQALMQGDAVDAAADVWMTAVDTIVGTGRAPPNLGLARKSMVGRVREREREMRTGKYELNDQQKAELRHRELQEQLQEQHGGDDDAPARLLEQAVPCCAERKVGSPQRRIPRKVRSKA